jgi:hypothetical protein
MNFELIFVPGVVETAIYRVSAPNLERDSINRRFYMRKTKGCTAQKASGKN